MQLVSMTVRRAALLAVLLLAVFTPRVATAGSITLSWDASADPNVVGYIVYVGLEPRSYDQTYDVGNQTSFVYPDAVDGQQYYFSVAAYQAGPAVGSRSAEIAGYSNAPPTLANPGTVRTIVGQSSAIQLIGADPEGRPVSYTAAGLPPGITLNGSTGLLAGVSASIGLYSVTVTASDGLLVSSRRFNWEIRAVSDDVTPPTVAISSPTTGSSYSSIAALISLGGVASDAFGVAEVTWASSAGGSGVAQGTTVWSVGEIPLQPGSNILTVTARDAAGNVSTDTLTVTRQAEAQADTTAPVVTVSTPTAAATFQTTLATLSIGGSASDAVGVTQVSWSNDRGGSGNASGTANWTAAGIALQGGQNVLTVTARDAAGNTATDTLVVTRTIENDTTAPTIAISVPTASGAHATAEPALVMSGTAADNVGVSQVSWNNDRGGSGTANGTATWTIPGIALQSGVNMIAVTARDEAGNQASSVLTVTYTPPAPPTLVSPSGSLSDRTPTYVWNAAPGASQYLLYAVDAEATPKVRIELTAAQAGCGAGGECRYTPDVALASGAARWWVYATYTTGVSFWSAAMDLTIAEAADTAAPVVAIVAPTAAATYAAGSASLTLSGTASDAVGVTQVSWVNHRGGSGTASGTTAWTASGIQLQNGQNLLTVTARDAAGNTATDTLTVTYSAPVQPAAATPVSPSGTIDTLTPVFVWNAAPTAVKYTLWVVDTGADPRIRLALTPAQAGCAAGGQCSVAPGVVLATGAARWQVQAEFSGADPIWSATRTFTVRAQADTVAPAIAISSPTAAATYTSGSATVSLGGSASDAVGVTQVTWTNSRGGSGSASGTSTWTIAGVALQAGENVLTVTARDDAGNTANDVLVVSYAAQATGPATLVSPSGTVETTTPTFIWNAAPSARQYMLYVVDRLANPRIRLELTPEAAGCAAGGQCMVSPGVALATGDAKWWVYTVPASGAGIWSTAADITVRLPVDVAAPVVSITGPTAAATHVATSASLTLSGTAADTVGVTRVSWSTDRGMSGTASGTSTWTVPAIALSNGVNIITVTAQDAAGNTAHDVLTVTWTAPDTTAPAVSVTIPTAASSHTSGTGTLALGGTASDAVGVTQVSWTSNRGGGGVATGTTSWAVPGLVLQTGQNVITVTARDAAGNTASDTITITWAEPDTTAPQVAIGTPTTGGEYTATTASLTLGGSASDAVGVTRVTWSTSRGASGVAGGTANWVASNVPLASGVTVITITAHDAAGNSASDSLAVTWVEPGPATLVSPSGPTATTTPTFVWNAAPGATKYLLWVVDPQATPRMRLEYTPAQAGCAAGGQCSVSPDVAVSPGDAKWWVYATLPGTSGTWSEPLEFRVQRAVDAVAPSVSIGAPTAAASYVTTVSPLTLGGTASDAVGVTRVEWRNDRGGSGLATSTSAWTVPAVALHAGVNVITVVASDAAGNTSSDVLTVTFNPPAVAASTLVAPTGALATATPTFVWSAAAGASHYLLYVVDTESTPKIRIELTPAEAGCASDNECMLAPGIALAPGAAKWWVFSSSAPGVGTWSAAADIIVPGSGPAAGPEDAELTVPLLVSPVGTLLGTSSPTYSWKAVPAAVRYLLFVTDATRSGKVRVEVLPSDAGCGTGTGTCSFNPGISLARGAVRWWIYATDSRGNGLWSAPGEVTVP